MKHTARITASVLCTAALLLTGCSRSKPVTQDSIKLPEVWWIGADSFTPDGTFVQFYDSGIPVDGCDIPSEEFYQFSNPDGDKLFYDKQGRFRAYQYHITSAYDCSYDPSTNRKEPDDPAQTHKVEALPVENGIVENETPDENTDAPVQMSDREMIRLSLDSGWAPYPDDLYREQAYDTLEMLVPDFRKYTERDEAICQYDAVSGIFTPCRVTVGRRYGEAVADRAEVIANIADTVEDVKVEYADIADPAAVSEQLTAKTRSFAEDYFRRQYGSSFQGFSGISGNCRSISGRIYGFFAVSGTVGEHGQPALEISENFIVCAD